MARRGAEFEGAGELSGWPGLVVALVRQSVKELLDRRVDDPERMAALFYLVLAANDDLEAVGLSPVDDPLGRILARRGRLGKENLG